MKYDRLFLGILSIVTTSLVVASVSKIVGARTQETSGQGQAFVLAKDIKAKDVIGRKPHIKGNTNAPVTLVEFGDYQCPPCESMHSQINDRLTRAQGRWRLVFRHLPLSFHSYAYVSAVAAEAAGQQNRFWEMHDKLYMSNGRLSEKDRSRYAQELKLNMSLYKSMLAEKQFPGFNLT